MLAQGSNSQQVDLERKYQKQQQRADQLENLSATVSHEVRTPIQTSLQLIQTILDLLSMQEMAAGAPLEYTGKCIPVAVTHILHGPAYGLKEGWVIMSIERQ